MLSLWANWLQLNSQLNSPGVSFWLYRRLSNMLETVKDNVEYRTGTSIRQAPVFRHLRALWKSPWKFVIWMNEFNYNYTACCWFPTSSNILILPSQFWQIRFESYTDCTVQSAEYWCFYGTCNLKKLDVNYCETMNFRPYLSEKEILIWDASFQAYM